MDKMSFYDSVIIGFGKGGKTLAGKLAAHGEKVALIEKSPKMYGGTCINVGCIPTKFLVNNAKLSSIQGGSFEQKAQRYTDTIVQKNGLISKLRQKNYDKLASNPNITVIDGTAEFVDSTHVKVINGADELTVEGKKIFINTGAYSFVPPIKGLKESKYFADSSSLLDEQTLPKELVIIGAGYIGLEFASIYSDFGSNVTIVEGADKFLPREDEEIAQEVFKCLESKGVKILLSTQIEEITDGENQACIRIKNADGESRLYADKILCAAGRRPNTQGLNLSAAGVEVNERGAVVTDDGLKTTAENIWAMGDVTGGLQFTYISLDDSRIVGSHLFSNGERTTLNRGVVPYSVFINPPFSRVGLSEKEAVEKGYKVKVVKLPAAAIPKANVLNQTQGLLKAVINQEDGMILGAHLFCEESHEIINLIKLAIDNSIPYSVLRDNIYTHPTMSEALNDLFAVSL